MTRLALATRGVQMRFGSFLANDDVTLEVPVGERRVLIGPNGAGKSTLFNVLAGQLRPTAGSVELLGQDVTRLPAHRRARMGLARTFQLNNLFTDLTVRQNVEITLASQSRSRVVFWRDLASVPGIRARSDALLDTWEFTDLADLPVSELAYGQQRVMEIVLAMSTEPQVLLLDEPTAGLAPADAHRLTRLVSELPREITIIMIEHDMDVAFALADRVTVLHQGSVLADDLPERVAVDRSVLQIYLGDATDA
ncbi:ABC transporter ATP-binding protein [Modestobacter sp. VKM Ac-2985]|uniref:ABC transporter ATP-binding protein n=1 Tax=Modestobacter sp. VKM Ac-2985 TaxID=3004139 RepID=UPI0022AB7B6A|nr:ABC transporter ATP-binding protein [Modestobacter sp. VKM Ac-2985]MCZ2837316.1 ABC transporter ATP-binding protein [Modestobacter sp. VKM Ac-2985]